MTGKNDFNRFIPAGSSQAAYHYRANLVPIPQGFSLAERYQHDYPPERLRSGLSGLHRFIAAIYQAGVETPEVLVPTSLSTRQKGLKEADFTTYSRLLFALGQYGKIVEYNGQAALEVALQEMVDFCARARIKSFEPFFTALEKLGLSYSHAPSLRFTFPSNPDLLPALTVFARACRALTNKDINPPPEFKRADLRLLQINRKKVRQVPLEPEEAIRALSDENEAAFIREVDGWARSMGYVAEIRCTGVHKSEFNAVYRLPKPARALFGFRTEDGHIHMHVNFNNTRRILPYIAQTARPFRDLYYERCTCAECHACEDGPYCAILDGAARRLCGYSYMNMPEVPADCYQPLQYLLRIQDEFLKGNRVEDQPVI